MKKVKFEDLEIGKRYHVETGIWKMNNLMYVGLIARMQRNGKQKRLPLFTCGNLETWEDNINIHTAKSNIKVYEER